MPETVELHVRLTPKASQNRIAGWQQDASGRLALKVSVTAVPEKGKANKALIDLLAKQLKRARSDVTIVRGETDKNKTLIIKGDSQEIFSRLPAPPH